jgi:hypothetical protein
MSGMSKGWMSPGLRVLVGFLVVNGVICAGGGPLAIYWSLNPPGRVQVCIVGLREDVYFASCVAECNGELQNMEWSLGNLFEPQSPVHPKDWYWSNPNVIRKSHPSFNPLVVWKFGRRYGVVTRNTEKQWRVTWFEPDDLQGSSCFWYISGNGLVTFNMAKRQTETLSVCDVEGLGLDDVK